MNISTKCPKCGSELVLDDKWLGHSIECPYCQSPFTFSSNSTDHPKRNVNTSQERTMKQYKVLTQKDKWFSGKFDPEKLEGAINAYAKQGWRFVGCATASIPGLIGGTREEMVIILERG